MTRVRVLAKRLGVAPGRVTVLRGEAGRDKLVEVEGLDNPDPVRRALLPDA